MRYLLDTNVWVALLRNSSAALAKRFQAIASTGDLRVCSIVRAELRYGALCALRQLKAWFGDLRGLVHRRDPETHF
jgi:predicted nucleic acid-binding protein